jgi:hypothetical protein
MKKILCALILASSLCGCSTFWRGAIAVHDAIDDALATKTNAPAVTQDPAPIDSGEAQTLWPSVACPQWMVHTSDHPADDAIREAAWKSAKAQGLDAIRMNLKHTDNYHLVMALYEHEHKDEHRYRLDNFTRRARDKGGVKRWVVDLAPGISLEWVGDIFLAYGPGTDFQLQIVNPSKEATKVLGLDAQGIKVSPPRKR